MNTIDNNNCDYIKSITSQNYLYLKKLASKQRLNKKEVVTVVTNIMNGYCSDIFISSFLMALVLNEESLDELQATLESIRSNSIKIHPISDFPIVDNCGTGGDFLNTFNISTVSAIIASSCKKIAMAKHGNKSSSSLSGSADFFEYIGYKINNETSLIVRSIETCGLGFLYAPNFHPGLKYVSKVRKELGLRTIFNKVGPLCNPCENLYGQVIGVSDPSLLKIIPKLIPVLGLQHAMVIRSLDGMDELSTTSKNAIIHVYCQDKQYKTKSEILDPTTLDIPRSTMNEIAVKDRVQSIIESLRIVYGIQSNKSKENIVLLNSAAALVVSDKVDSFEEGIAISRDSLNNGHPQKLLKTLIKNFGDISILENAEKHL